MRQRGQAEAGAAMLEPYLEQPEKRPVELVNLVELV
jgi:hypothetical protein